ncbi:MAG: hypothetical protein KDK33_04570 [Leptospiraceae bacterium]|nr:hypothetical protein [Leptospiraceae bacterium]
MSDEMKVMEGKIDADYKWNPGSTVGRFLTSLRDDGEIIGVRCTKTSKVFLPPQSWSPYGKIKMDRFVTITTAPRLKAGTIIHQKPWNAPEGMEVPYMLAAVEYPGADTELIHLVKGNQEQLKALKSGAPLKAVWADERKGTIRDILYFEPA